ncbi:MAG: response regulator [Candidatus Hodarchaeales archaeon]
MDKKTGIDVATEEKASKQADHSSSGLGERIIITDLSKQSWKITKRALHFKLELTRHMVETIESIEVGELLVINKALKDMESLCSEYSDLLTIDIKNTENHFEIKFKSEVLPISYFHHIFSRFFAPFPYSYSSLVKIDDYYVLRFEKNKVLVKVGILDDNQQILSLLTRFFSAYQNKKYSFQVFATTEPDLFISQLSIEQVDVAIVDEKLPNQHSGIKILERVKKNSPGSIRVLITGYPEFTLAQEAISRAHVDLFVPKPIKREELLQLVCSELDVKHKIDDHRYQVPSKSLLAFNLREF